MFGVKRGIVRPRANEPEATVELPPSAWRVRAGWYGLAAAEAEPDYDLGGDRSPESIVLEIWLSTETGIGSSGAGAPNEERARPPSSAPGSSPRRA